MLDQALIQLCTPATRTKASVNVPVSTLLLTAAEVALGEDAPLLVNAGVAENLVSLLTEVIGNPNLSVVGAGIVLISATGMVTFRMKTPVFVKPQRHVGVSVGTKSLTKVVVLSSYPDALVYVTRNTAAFSVFVAAKLASGVAWPWEQCVRFESMGPMPPCCGPEARQQMRLSRST